MYKTMMESRKPIKIVARLFVAADGQWGVRPGAAVLYAIEPTKPGTETVLFQSIDTGDTRSTQAGMIEWLEGRARRRVKEALQLKEEEALKLVIETDIRIES